LAAIPFRNAAFFDLGTPVAKRSRSERYVSRGGDKLHGALDVFGYDATGVVAADLGSNVGGFTDCLLQHGASRVYAVDTGYGVLEWKLRQDSRVVTLERTNALHVQLPERVQLAVVDVGWTPMTRILPIAIACLELGGTVIALLKPQYEAAEGELDNGVVKTHCLEAVLDRVLNTLASMEIQVANRVESAVPGSGGNREFFIRIPG